MVDDNEHISKRYRPPAPQAIRSETFEHEFLDVYAWPALRFGGEYERVDAKVEARAWYERALAIDPDLSLAREGLAVFVKNHQALGANARRSVILSGAQRS